MWKIGNVEIKSHVVLAPMAGVTTYAYRNFMKEFGVGLIFTEMVSDCGLRYGNQKTIEYLSTSSEERPIGIQLFGSNATSLCEAIEIVEKQNDHYDFLDINLGCPVPKVTKAGSGSSLLKDPQYLYDLMSKVVEKSSKPVTAKIRLGWDEKSINVFEVCNVLVKAGVSAISIHARTAKQAYSGKPNFDIIKGLGKSLSVPLIISGDIYTVEDAINAVKTTDATAVMVARGGIGNPSLIEQINDYFESREIREKCSLEDNKKHLLKYAKMLVEEKGEKTAISMLRGIAPKFYLGYSGTKETRIKLAQSINSFSDLLNILN